MQSSLNPNGNSMGTQFSQTGRFARDGVWKNSEDEILKAAVMKYGTQQWARISSLLTRKTPKQCKARWFEWLDPSIKKLDWSSNEDAQLLQLVKIMPSQWRSIGPIIGRTAAQCFDRYNQLVQLARETPGGGSGSIDNSSTTGRGARIGVDPENKPARPDAIDMDDEELEMLAEARARLANTQGKKAKRKARERQLEEARKLSTLQKARELKQAGVDISNKKKKKKTPGIDLANEIPYKTDVPAGFYDTSLEDEREKNKNKEFQATLLQKIDGKRKADKELENRKKDAKKIKQQREDGEYMSSSMKKLKNEAEKEVIEPAIIPNEISNFFDKSTGLEIEDFELFDSLDDYTPSSKTQVKQTNSLTSLFSSLPKPKNDFELEDLEESEDIEQPKKSNTRHDIIYDAGSIEKSQENMVISLKEEILKKRSTVFKNKLPIPKTLPKLFYNVLSNIYNKDSRNIDLASIEDILYPGAAGKSKTKGTSKSKSKSKSKKLENILEDKDLINNCNELIIKELCKLVAYDFIQESKINETSIASKLDSEDLNILAENEANCDYELRNFEISSKHIDEATKLVEDEMKNHENVFSKTNVLNDYRKWKEMHLNSNEDEDYYKREWSLLRNLMIEKAAFTKKLEKKVVINLTGFQNVYNKIQNQIISNFKEYINDIIQDCKYQKSST